MNDEVAKGCIAARWAHESVEAGTPCIGGAAQTAAVIYNPAGLLYLTSDK